LSAGTLVGSYFGWPASFLLVATLAMISVVGIMVGLPAVAAPSSVGLRARLEVAYHPPVLMMLVVSVLGFSGFYAVFTYIAPIAHTIAGLGSVGLSGVLLVAGIGGLVGIILGGIGADRWSAWKVQAVSLAVIGSMLLATGQLASSSPGPLLGLLSLIVTMVLWWGASWALSSPNKKILLTHAPDTPAVVFSLSNSANYIGISLGGALGGIALQHAGSAAVGFLGGGLASAALIIFLVGRRLLDPPGSQ
ncbi:MAG: MFS transporter, partial [Candidatus Dormibacteraceae bacterium]